MADESEGERILKEREAERAAARQRIAKEREARRAEVERLRSIAAGRGPPPPSAPAGPPAEAPRGAPPAGSRGSRERVRRPGVEPVTQRAPTQRIGGPIVLPEIGEFLATDPTDRFDIQTVNRLRLAGLVLGAGEDRQVLSAISDRAAALMARVKQEVDDPLNAGAFLRERVLEWYRESPQRDAWAEEAPGRWGGLFADSRQSGGRLLPWINVRLRAVREEAMGTGRVASILRQRLRRDRKDQALVARTTHQQIVAEVAQALLDDIAGRRREPGAPFPLVHLSELAMRRQVATVNDVLGLLFSSPEMGPFVVLHPNRYPDCEELEVRPPSPNATGAALAYSLVAGRAGRRGTGRGGASGEGAGETGGGGEATLDENDLDGSSVWEAESVTPEAWRRIAEGRRRERRRLEAPPKDYRSRAAYEPLRDLLLQDPEFRKLFLSVRWRGRPAGLPLLATLLQKGKFAPDVATDHEYLDAELEELRGGEAGEPDVWRFGGWTVRREGGHAEGFRYAAEREEPAAGSPP
jgi:hypothetical protein